jgi:hypothetical protein
LVSVHRAHVEHYDVGCAYLCRSTEWNVGDDATIYVTLVVDHDRRYDAWESR